MSCSNNASRPLDVIVKAPELFGFAKPNAPSLAAILVGIGSGSRFPSVAPFNFRSQSKSSAVRFESMTSYKATRRDTHLMPSNVLHSAARFLRRLQCSVRPVLWKLNRVSQSGKHVFFRECLAQAQKCWLPSAVSRRDVRHLPFLAQRFGDALNFRLLRQHEMQPAKNTVHAILDRTRRCKNVLDARMGTSDD